jgi:MoxR-like ATPase
LIDHPSGTVRDRPGTLEAPDGWRDLDDVLAAGIDRVILYGPPGTGKTYAALTLGASDDAERLVCTEELTSADITGCYVPAGSGEWSWQEGPAVRAWRHGRRLVVDEVDRAAGDVLSLLLAMTDSVGSATWRNPSTGELLRPMDSFTVIMTTNVDAVDEIPAALRDRFPVAIRIDRPHPRSVVSLSPELREMAIRASLGDDDRRMSLRAFFAFDQLRRYHGDDRAARLVLGDARAEPFLDALSIATIGS